MWSQCRISTKLCEVFKSSGLKVARQKYEYNAAGNKHNGENVYAVLNAPRGDATEAIVLVAAWINMDGELNHSGITLVLTLARYFKSAYLPSTLRACALRYKLITCKDGPCGPRISFF